MKDKITILVPTSVTISAPSTRLIENALDSAAEMLLKGEEARWIVHLDRWDDSSASRRYHENLKRLTGARGYELVHGSRGLSCSFRFMMSMVDTDYYLFLEHDWKFFREIDLEGILRMMDAHREINYVRFNKRSNIIHGFDKVLEPIVIDGIRLLKSDNWSGNPHIGRTRVFREKWAALLPSEPERGTLSEIYVLRAYQKEIQKSGFEEAWKNWGVCIYGKRGEQMAVQHLDGNRWGVSRLRALAAKIKKRLRR